MPGVPHLLTGGEGAHGQGRVLDELAANATVAPVTRLVGGWLCKTAPGLPFRRANAALPVFGAGIDLGAAADVLSTIEHLVAGRGQRVLIQVSSADPSAVDLDAFLAEQGYTVEAPVDLLVGEMGDVVDGARERPAPGVDDRTSTPVEIVVETGIDQGWGSHYGELHGDDALWRERTAAYGEMLAVLGPAVLTGVALPPSASPEGAGEEVDAGPAAEPEGAAGPTVGGDLGPRPHVEVAGVGFAVLERGWAGIYGMATAVHHRRTGVARAMLVGLATHAAACGARRLYLQVEQDNGPAQRLYRSMGFVDDHRYHYRVSRPR